MARPTASLRRARLRAVCPPYCRGERGPRNGFPATHSASQTRVNAFCRRGVPLAGTSGRESVTEHSGRSLSLIRATLTCSASGAAIECVSSRPQSTPFRRLALSACRRVSPRACSVRAGDDSGRGGSRVRARALGRRRSSPALVERGAGADLSIVRPGAAIWAGRRRAERRRASQWIGGRRDPGGHRGSGLGRERAVRRIGQRRRVFHQ
jgi:hypothetical protein